MSRRRWCWPQISLGNQHGFPGLIRDGTTKTYEPIHMGGLTLVLTLCRWREDEANAPIFSLVYTLVWTRREECESRKELVVPGRSKPQALTGVRRAGVSMKIVRRMSGRPKM